MLENASWGRPIDFNAWFWKRKVEIITAALQDRQNQIVVPSDLNEQESKAKH